MRKLGCITLLCAMMALFGCQSTSDFSLPEIRELPKSPIDVKFLRRRKGEGVVRTYYFDITITNHYKKTRWFVLPVDGSVPLKKDEMFSAKSPKLMPFVTHKLKSKDGEGYAVRLMFDGKDKFLAFHLLPQGRLHLENHSLTSQRDFDTLECWEAKRILVNSKHDLENWLPYDTRSTQIADIKGKVLERRLDLNRKGTKQRTDFPTEEVMHLWVMPDQKWQATIERKAE